MEAIKIGFAPTRRSIFSAPDAVKYANLTRDKLNELNIEFVDIAEFNEDGLLYDDADVMKIAAKFKRLESKVCFYHILILERNMFVRDLLKS